MSFEEKYEKDKEYYDRKVLKTQKVKLYNLKHWIFDFGGVMVETPNIVKKLIAIINKDLGTSMSKEHPYVMKTRRRLSSGRITSKEFLKKIMEKFYYSKNKNAPKVDLKHYLELWFQKYSEITHISPEMEEIVERLHKAGYHISLMSNTYDIHAKSNDLRGFFDLFDKVFLSNELKMRKPDIEKYKYVIKKLKTKPKDCIFIDDKLMNLVPARKLGIIVIQFKSFKSFKKYLSELGISEIEDDLKDILDVKYKIYKTTKKDYKKSKKKVKKLRKGMKQLKKKKKKSHFRTMAKQLRYAESKLKKRKSNYEKQKKAKKEILEPKIKLSK